MTSIARSPARAAWETASDAGIGGREEQQDRVLVLARGGAQVLALADGMGGHAGGALAAQAVVDVVRERFGATEEGDPKRWLAEVVIEAHARINAIGAARRISPHSTCVVLHLTNAAATWAHVGDSRLYRFRSGRLAGRTMDHSVVELMRLQGRISEEEMRTHPDQNRLYEALGGEKTPELSLDDADAAMFDGFLLASDGLWEHATDRELAAAIRARDLAAALRGLVQRAKFRGGPHGDNIAVAAARRNRITPFGERAAKLLGRFLPRSR